MKELKLKRLERNLEYQLNKLLKPECKVSISKMNDDAYCMQLSIDGYWQAGYCIRANDLDSHYRTLIAESLSKTLTQSLNTIKICR